MYLAGTGAQHSPLGEPTGLFPALETTQARQKNTRQASPQDTSVTGLIGKLLYIVVLTNNSPY